jgi:hypothetical protein
VISLASTSQKRLRVSFPLAPLCLLAFRLVRFASLRFHSNKFQGFCICFVFIVQFSRFFSVKFGFCRSQLLHSFLLLFCHLAFECLTIIPYQTHLVKGFFEKN